MSGTKESAKKTAATNKSKDKDYYRKIGSMGGKASVNKISKRGPDGRFIKREHVN